MKKSSLITILIILAVAIGIGYLLGPGKIFQGRLTGPTVPSQPVQPTQEKPNLLLSDMKLEISTYPKDSENDKGANYNYDFFLTIKNTKGVDIDLKKSAIMNICLSAGGQTVQNFSYASGKDILPKYSSLILKIPLNINFSGMPSSIYTFKCAVDHGNVIDESDETDNMKSLTVKHPPLPNLKLESAKTTAKFLDVVQVGSAAMAKYKYTVVLTIKNDGMINITNAKNINVFCGNLIVGFGKTPFGNSKYLGMSFKNNWFFSLAKSSTVIEKILEVEIPFYSKELSSYQKAASNYNVYCKIDIDNSFQESNESDNDISFTIPYPPTPAMQDL